MTDPTPLAGSTANSLEAGAPSNATVGANAPAIRAAARVAALALGALYAFPHPYRFSTDDAVSYLDVADAYWHRHWSSAINGYWSPLYSWMLAVVKAWCWSERQPARRFACPARIVEDESHRDK